RPDDDHLHTSLLCNQPHPLLSFHFGNAIRVLRTRRIKGSVWPTGCRILTVDLDGADEDEAFNTSGGRPTSQIQSAFNIDLTKFCQGVVRLIIHDVHASGGMNDHTASLQRL